MSNDRCLVLTPDIDFQKAPRQFEAMRLVSELGIKPVLTEELGITCFMLDSKQASELVRTLGQVDFIIANLSSIDPNICYLIGACHSLALPVLLVSDETESLPTILQGYTAVFYSSDVDNSEGLLGFRQELRREVSRLLESELHNPIEDYFPFEKRPVSLKQYTQLEDEKIHLVSHIKTLQENLEYVTQALQLAQLGIPIIKGSSRENTIKFKPVR